MHDPRLLDLVSRIKCLPLDEADKLELANLCELEVVLKSGARKTVRVEFHRGHFKNPMPAAEMEEKFRLMAQKHLRADRVDNLLRILWGIENEPQVTLSQRRARFDPKPAVMPLADDGVAKSQMRRSTSANTSGSTLDKCGVGLIPSMTL